MTFQLRASLDLASNVPSWRQVAISCMRTLNRHPALLDLMASGIAFSVITSAWAANNPQAAEGFSSRYLSQPHEIETDESIQPSSIPPELQCIQMFQAIFGRALIPIDWVHQCVQSLREQPPGQSF